jgi:hypothetical protein
MYRLFNKTEAIRFYDITELFIDDKTSSNEVRVEREVLNGPALIKKLLF